MKISLNWLKEYVSFDLDNEALDTLFSTRSQEVENIESLVKATNLVIGYVKNCVPHPDADKLNVCEVDVDTETLTIVCGAPNVKADQYVIVAKNGAILPGDFEIKKATIRGVESNGMICSLDELGIEHKYHNETGIHEIKNPVKVGEPALKALSLDDTVLTLELTPNRSDLLSIHGVAYDLAAMVDAPLNIPDIDLDFKGLKASPVEISTNTPDCMSYYGAVIEDIEIKESPLWMKSRLIAAGIRPINNVVDITNYVMIETGQPLHAFDYEALNSDKIIVRNALQDEKFITLDDKERTLNEQDIVITNGKKPIALAGVMGGAETEVTPKTTSILLESAVFNPLNVRKTSSRLDLRSESSMRFERGIDVKKTLYALKRACQLFSEHASGKLNHNYDYFDHTQVTPKTIEVHTDVVNKVLGSHLSTHNIASLLTRLRFDYQEIDDNFIIEKPSRRPDFSTYQDIIEEIGRLIGYDTLDNTLPQTVSIGGLSKKQQFRRRLRQTLSNLGIDEAVTYSMQNPNTIHDYTYDKTLQTVSVMNPMSDQKAMMRLSTLNGLVDVVQYNKARQSDHVHIFEVGSRYTKETETEMLGIALCGTYQTTYWKTDHKTDFYTLKGLFDSILDRFNVLGVTYKQTTLDNFHPHQCAEIIINNQVIGVIGKMHPKVAEAKDLEDVYLLEVEVDGIFTNQAPVDYNLINRYPSIARDIAIVLDKDIQASSVTDTIKDTAKPLLESIELFDVYVGEHIEKDKKSLGIRMRFTDNTQTLKTETIDQLIDSILEALNKAHKATLR